MVGDVQTVVFAADPVGVSSRRECKGLIMGTVKSDTVPKAELGFGLQLDSGS